MKKSYREDKYITFDQRLEKKRDEEKAEEESFFFPEKTYSCP